MPNIDPVEHRLCGEFWVWLYAERQRRGMEPSEDEKAAHPSLAALRMHRARVSNA